MIRAERHIETEKEVCGGITVFLSLILTCICALMGGLFESARAAGSGWYMQMALNSSLDSLMSCYHREIWDKYRIFVLECADKEPGAPDWIIEVVTPGSQRIDYMIKLFK